MLKHPKTVYGLSFSPDGKLLATAGEDEVVRLWDLATNSEQTQLQGHKGEVFGVCFSPDGKCLLSCGEDSRRSHPS